ncbi:MAG TPA: DUF979 domain-containing protein [Burkholderiaceae bacterium]
MTLLRMEYVFYLIGAIVMTVVLLTLRDRSNPKRYATALFWFLFASTFLFGDAVVGALGKPLAYKLVGMLVIVLALIAGAGLLGAASYPDYLEEKLASARRLGNRLFVPALTIPAVTIACALLLKDVQVAGWSLFDPKHLTFCALALACVVAIGVGGMVTGGTPLTAVRESRRLIDAVGWALILPQMLAMLGGVFVAAQTGKSITTIVNFFVDPSSRMTLAAMYCIGMALFTIVMGNAFAAFPVMTAGIGLPYLIVAHHGNPAAVVAIGMFSGYCGTLMTPMAANFNIVPAALLELKDKYHVIRVQIPSALAILCINIVLLNLLAFR